MAYTVYFENSRGTKRFNKKSYATKARAITVAKRASRMTGGYVTISKGYKEVAECYRGSCRIR